MRGLAIVEENWVDACINSKELNFDFDKFFPDNKDFENEYGKYYLINKRKIIKNQ